MNKRKFLKLLGLSAVGSLIHWKFWAENKLDKLGFIGYKVNSKSINGITVIPRAQHSEFACFPNETYVSDWIICDNSEILTEQKCIKCANDIEGWYDEVILTPPTFFHTPKHFMQWHLKRVYNPNIRFVYTGKNPEYLKYV